MAEQLFEGLLQVALLRRQTQPGKMVIYQVK